ncbi:hypothetical protein RRG08_066707, partial [Elysia crispata]
VMFRLAVRPCLLISELEDNREQGWDGGQEVLGPPNSYRPSQLAPDSDKPVWRCTPDPNGLPKCH